MQQIYVSHTHYIPYKRGMLHANSVKIDNLYVSYICAGDSIHLLFNYSLVLSHASNCSWYAAIISFIPDFSKAAVNSA